MALDSAYKALYTLVGADPEDHFVFTSSGAEAINHVIFSAYLDITRKTGKNHFITSTLDEAPQILAISRLQELGCVMHLVEADASGKIPLQNILDAITPRTALLSLSHTNGLTGVENTHLAEISQLCKERGILFHIDASHILGRGNFIWDADVVTFHGEDIGGYPGTGGLFIKGKHALSPLILGGEEQANMRGGSFSIQALDSLGKAAFDTHSSKDHMMTEIALLKCHFEETLLTHGCRVHFEEEMRTPHITCLEFPGIHNESLHALLTRRGIPCQIGGGRFQRLPLLLQACKKESYSSLSFSFTKETTRASIEHTLDIIKDAVTQLRKYSEGLV